MRKFIFLALIALITCSVNALEMNDYLYRKGLKGIDAATPSIDGEFYYKWSEKNSRIVKVSYKTGAETVVFDSNTARDCDVKRWSGFAMSADEGKILLYTNVVPMYRYSFYADYYVYELRHNKLTKLSDAGGEQIATFSPDGRMVAYVKDNNIYIKKLDYGTEVAVTKDGKQNEIINGLPDWVYQEEFDLVNSLTWSPDNLTLAFIRFDESKVPMWTMNVYEGGCEKDERYAQYPGQISYKYPVAGQQNSIVSVMAYDVDNRTLKKMQIPMNDEDYIPKIEFANDATRLMVSKMNRHQNELTIYAVNPRSTVAKSIYTEKSDTWINFDLAAQVQWCDQYFMILSEKSGFAHLYQYSNSGALMRQITNGNWDVTNYYGYDEKTKTHYFQSTMVSPLDRTICKVDAKGVISPVVSGAGTYSAAFSKNFAYYIQSFNDANTPNQYSICAANGKVVRKLEQNEEYAAKYCGRDIPKREFFTFTHDGITFNGHMYKPLDFNPAKKYPVIMSQYSGPGSQQVVNKWKLDWEAYFATQGYIVVCVDGRGTGFRGRSFRDVVYMRLGYYESIDQIAAANYMAQQPYVDVSHIGIYGWSFGGYETLMAMSQDDSPYAAGCAVAPVTSWRYYDTIYTERYMRTPAENQEGYDDGAPLNRTKLQKGKLLIMHGTSDDNVHVRNTIEYASRMIDSGKMMDMQLFANQNHSIAGCNSRTYVYTKMLDFFNNALKK